MNDVSGKISRVFITPELAKDWIENNNRRNRSVNKNIVSAYASDMKEGRWDYRFCNPIQFTESGNLANGQHRLKGVVESGIPGWFWVEKDVPDECQLVMDIGAKRNLAQYTKFSDLPKSIDKQMVATANMMYLGIHVNQRLTIAGQRDFIEKHYDALAFSEGLFASRVKGVSTAGVRAVMARAYYHAPQDEIIRFTDLLHLKDSADMTESRAKTVFALLRWLGKNTGAGQAAARLQYLHAEKALQFFIKGISLSLIRIRTDPVELFPLPEEQE